MDLLQLKEYKAKSFSEYTSREGWMNYGDDNMFPQYLIDLYQFERHTQRPLHVHRVHDIWRRCASRHP